MFVDSIDIVTGERRGDFTTLAIDAYPPSPMGVALREARVAANLSLRDAAALLDLDLLELSALERGILNLTASDWQLALSGVAASNAKPKARKRTKPAARAL